MTHTPGPWTTLQARSLINVKGANGEQVCQVRVERADDARLIAAAPDLLDACKRALQQNEQGAYNHCAETLLAAIAKAEGK